MFTPARPPIVSPTDSLATVARRMFAAIEVATEYGELRHITPADLAALHAAVYPSLPYVSAPEREREVCDLQRTADELGIDFDCDCCGHVPCDGSKVPAGSALLRFVDARCEVCDEPASVNLIAQGYPYCDDCHADIRAAEGVAE